MCATDDGRLPRRTDASGLLPSPSVAIEPRAREDTDETHEECPRKRVGASCRAAREARGPWWAWEMGCRCRPGPRSRESTPGCTPGRRRRTRDGALMRSAQSLAGVGTTRADAWWPQPSAHRVAESRRSAGQSPQVLLRRLEGAPASVARQRRAVRQVPQGVHAAAAGPAEG